MPEIGPEWLSTLEATARLGIGRTRLWMLVKEGRLTAYQLGPNRKARYYARAEVERLANEVRSAPSPHHAEDRG
jgi:excisionase family DNA binding protein